MDNFFGMPPPARKEGERYAVRPPHRGWTVQEMVVVLPPLLACGSERTYYRTLEFLCDVLDREPLFAPGDRPTAARRAVERRSLIERRTVTELLSGWPGAAAFLSALPLCRTSLPLTWAEKTKFLQPWARKPDNGQLQVPLAELATILGRDGADHVLLRDYVNGLPPRRARPELDDLRHTENPSPDDVRAFRDVPTDQVGAAAILWMRLNKQGGAES